MTDGAALWLLRLLLGSTPHRSDELRSLALPKTWPLESESGRAPRIGFALDCKRCDEEAENESA